MSGVILKRQRNLLFNTCNTRPCNFSDELERMNYAEALLRLMTLVLRYGRHFRTLLDEVIKAVIHGPMFQSKNNEHCLPAVIKSSHYSRGDSDKFYSSDWKHYFPAKIVREFCRNVICKVRNRNRKQESKAVTRRNV